MTYTHLTINELVLIEAYHNFSNPVRIVAGKLKRSRQTINNVYQFLSQGQTTVECYTKYKKTLWKTEYCFT